ncbi:MAG: hypothetical protein KJP21_03270, partial [Bacteroidia bacterium]|nr:hypothetical protein [Bacteroidia bacterium]
MKSVLFTYSFKEGLIGITRRKPYHTFRISEFPNSKALLCSMCRYIFILSFFVLETLACCGQTISPIIQTGHLDDVQVMQFTEDGKYLLSGGMDGMIIEWEMSSKMQTGSITGITGGVSCFKYNQEHKLLVAGSYENRVYVYDLDSSYEPVIEYEFDEYVTSVAISNDGKTIAAASADFSLTVFREDTIIRSFTRGDVVGLCFSKDNQTLYFGNYTGHVYRLDTKAKSFNDGVEMVHLAEEHISDIALSPEEKYLAFGTNGVNESGGTLGVVKLKNNKLLREEKVYVTYLGFQNNTIAFFDEKTIVFKDQDDELSKWIFRKNKILKLVNKTLYSGLAVSLDKRWVAYFNEEKLKLVNPLNVAQERILQGKAENPSRIVGVFDNQLFAEYPSGIKQWDVKKLNATLYKEKFYEDKWDYIAFSRDLTLVGNSFSVREANTGLRVGPYFTHAGNVRLAGFSHDNDFFFLLDENGQFTVSCLDTLNRPYWAEKIVRKWYFDKNYAFQHIDEIAISPTENKLAIMAEGFYLFDLESGEFTNYDVSIRNSDVNLPALFDPIQNRLLVASSREAYDTIAYEGRTGFDREWVSKKVNRIGSE